MRGRVIILLVLIAVAAAAAVAAVVLGGSSDEGNGTADGGTTTTTTGGEAVDVGATQTAQAAIDSDGELPTPTVDQEFVVIALQDLSCGFTLTRDFLSGPSAAVGLAPWPRDNVPSNSFDNVEVLENLVVRSDIPRESPVLSTQLVEDFTSLARVGSDAALLLPPGQVAVSMPLDRFGVGSVARGLQPGDTVDVILSFLFIDVDEVFQSRQPNQVTIITRSEEGDLEFSEGVEGRVEPSTLSTLGIVVGPSEVQRPRLVTQRTVQQALVVHVGFFPEDGRILGVRTPTPFDTPTPPPAVEGDQPTPTPPGTPTPTEPVASIVTLGVSPQDALVLVWALDSQIPMTFALRSATETGQTPTTAVSLQYMLTNYGISEEDIPNLPFALEPPIRSLRTVELEIFTEFVVPQGNAAQ